MKYLKKFEIHPEYTEFIETDDFIKPNVSCCVNDGVFNTEKEIHYNRLIVFRTEYLTFTATEPGTFKFNGNDISYSLDDGISWKSLPSNTDTPTVDAGKKIMWKASGLTPTESRGIGIFSSTGKFDVSGNVMSLVEGDDFVNTNTMASEYQLAYLFSSCTKLENAINMILPMTTLTSRCYQGMFNECTSLITAPELPATTLAIGCYFRMFWKCYSLTTAPTLPATTLKKSCYQGMFQDCTSLINAPQLPAYTVAESAYSLMFSGCTSLVNAPELPAQNVSTQSYAAMFQGCTSLVNAPELPARYLGSSNCSACYLMMFEGCTSLVTAPYLPAWSLCTSCYERMFKDCTSLVNAPYILPCYMLSDQCYAYMFAGCTSLQTAPILAPLEWGLSGNEMYSMFNGCTNLNCIKSYISAQQSQGPYHMRYWVTGVASTGTFVLMDGASFNYYNENGIPTGWTVTTETPTYEEECLTFTCIRSTVTSSFQARFSDATASSLEYSIDHGYKWYSYKDDRVLMPSAKHYMFRASGLVPKDSDATTPGIGYFYCSASPNTLKVCGNIMSMVYGSDFRGKTTMEAHQFEFLFKNMNQLRDASNLVLQSTTLSEHCYRDMFNGCTSLQNSPRLPATTLANYCYKDMFQGCTSLTTAPALPATEVGSYSYQYMFRECTSLTTAPELPATTLDSYCYSYMFCGCTSLISAPELPSTVMKSYCYEYMFRDCTNLITPPALPATTLGNGCYRYMFFNCSSLISCPELHATELKSYCYNGMFEHCTSIKLAPALPATILKEYCYYYMFYECTSLENTPELNALELVSYCYGYMFTGCSKINYAKALFTTRPDAGDGVNNWLTDVWLTRTSTTGIFVKNINATWPQNSQTGIPSSWTILYFDPATEKYYLSDKTTECDDHGNKIDMHHVLDYVYTDGSMSSVLDTSKTPVGIVVAPASHFSDNKMRVISLVNMQTGTATHQGTTTGGSMNFATNSSISGTKTEGAIKINPDNTANGTLPDGTSQDTRPKLYMPCDNGTYEYTDGTIKYWGKYLGSNINSQYETPYFGPSPYLSDGITFNPVYSSGGSSNVLSYMNNGVSNTNSLVSYLGNDAYAAKSCKLFYPGFNNGNWYLPTIGEWGYVINNISKINEKIDAIGSAAVKLNSVYWSSNLGTNFSSDSVCIYYAWECIIHNDSNYIERFRQYDPRVGGVRVRAFLRIDDPDISQ